MMQSTMQASVAPSIIGNVGMPHLKARVSILRFCSASGRSSASNSCSLSRTSSSVSGTACIRASFHVRAGAPGLSAQIYDKSHMTYAHGGTMVAISHNSRQGGKIRCDSSCPCILDWMVFEAISQPQALTLIIISNYILGSQVDHIPYPQHDACVPQRFAYPLRLFIRLCCSTARQLLSLPLPSFLQA